MNAVRSEGTKPERAVTAALIRLGKRFTCNPELPGKPDIVIDRTAIFVDGCLFHGHCCRTLPAWIQKRVDEQVARDRTVSAALTSGGWRAIRLWECETRNFAGLVNRISLALR
jgi:DNA mismatch endonuclease (patch repair protein)